MRHLRLFSFPIGLLCLGFVAPNLRASGEASSTVPANLLSRAEKILTPLGLADQAQAERVSLVIARHYLELGKIHDTADAVVKAQRTAHASAEVIKSLQDETELRLWNLHASYIGELTAELTPEQIDEVKDGMTYGVLPLTFRVYQQMLPTLTDEQKRQIHAWLAEAREHAIDAGSSEAKHAWFGKYKGRINNYLAHAGYDLKAAEKNLHP